MATIVLGNTAPIEPVKVSEDSTEIRRVPRPDLAPTETEFRTDNDLNSVEVLQIAGVFRSHHSDADASWVSSDDSKIEALLAAEFDCPIGRPRAKRTRKK